MQFFSCVVRPDNVVHEGEEGWVDRSAAVLHCLVWSVRSHLLRRDDCVVVRCTEYVASCAVSLPCPSASSPDAPLAIAELECQRCSAVQVFEHPADDSKNSLPAFLYDSTVLKAGESGLGVSKVVPLRLPFLLPKLHSGPVELLANLSCI